MAAHRAVNDSKLHEFKAVMYKQTLKKTAEQFGISIHAAWNTRNRINNNEKRTKRTDER